MSEPDLWRVKAADLVRCRDIPCVNVECNGLAEGVMMGKWPSGSGALEVIDNGEDRKQQPMTSHTLL